IVARALARAVTLLAQGQLRHQDVACLAAPNGVVACLAIKQAMFHMTESRVIHPARRNLCRLVDRQRCKLGPTSLASLLNVAEATTAAILKEHFFRDLLLLLGEH